MLATTNFPAGVLAEEQLGTGLKKNNYFYYVLWECGNALGNKVVLYQIIVYHNYPTCASVMDNTVPIEMMNSREIHLALYTHCQ